MIILITIAYIIFIILKWLFIAHVNDTEGEDINGLYSLIGFLSLLLVLFTIIYSIFTLLQDNKIWRFITKPSFKHFKEEIV